MIVYRLLPDGGFVCGNTKSHLTIYCYPSSLGAQAAKRNPKAAAKSLMMEETRIAVARDGGFAKEYDARNWKLLRERS